MAIGSTTSAGSNLDILANTATAIGSATATATADETSAVTEASQDMQVRVSPMADLLNKLQTLQQQDPTQFKQVASEIADQLHTAAQKAGSEGGFLNKLADRFAQAAQTGDLSAFRPQGGAGARRGAQGYHHHAHQAQEASAGKSSVEDALADALQRVNQAIEAGSAPSSTTT